MSRASNTQPADPNVTDPNVSDPSVSDPSVSVIGRAPTRVAQGPVPPAESVTQPVPPTPHAPTEQLVGDRVRRIGTHTHGAEGLNTPRVEAPKLRLTQGKIIPGTRYKIIRWVGEGGMGVVYEAEHIDIERRVALKILRFDLSQQPNMVKVFKDEAKAAGRLGSQYLVDLYDFGELPDGRLFFAMELLDGSDLVPSDTQQRMEPGRLIAILRQVCKGLGVAHKAGVVHRDVKPENIISTTAPDGRQQVKIVDFGISSMLAAGRDASGGIAGTPHYMAPEQILGQPFDGRLDIYALGCTAYELLVGEPPFEADTLESLLEKQISEQPIAPRQRRPNASIPAALEAVILRCLEKDASQRFQTTTQLEAALCEAQIAAGLTTDWDDLPVPELLDDPQRQAEIVRLMPSPHRPKARRGWMWPVVAGASTIAAVGLGAFLFLGAGPTAAEVNVVDTLTAAARDAASRANWVVPPVDSPDASTAIAKVYDLEELEGSSAALGDERGHDLRSEFAQTLIKHADELWKHGALDLARTYYFYALVFDDANAHAFERSGATPALLAGFTERARNQEFNDADRIMSMLAAAEMEPDADAKQERLEAVAAAIESDTTTEVLLAHSDSSRQLMARRRAKRKVKPAQEAPAFDPPADPVDAELDAVELDEDPPADEATPRERRRGKKTRRKIPDPTVELTQAKLDPERANALVEQGMAALRAGRRSEASSLFNQAISHDRRNAKALMGLSDVYFDTGKSQKAVEYAEKAVKASPANRNFRLKLGDAYFNVLRYKDALEQYEQAKKRGSKKADARIAKINAKVGQ